MNQTALKENVESNDSNIGKGQYLTFILNNEEYGVDILNVQEIKGWDTVTPIPDVPDYIRGVLNLRGTVIPIIDLRLRFKMEEREYDATTVVIVVNSEDEHGSQTIGFVVDAVSEVYSLAEENMKQTPNFGTDVRSSFLKGLASVEDKMIILLDINQLIDNKLLNSMDSKVH